MGATSFIGQRKKADGFRKYAIIAMYYRVIPHGD
jgi:hypothetical protein